MRILQSTGPADIHMDGARYHKRLAECVPSSNSGKDVLIAWLVSKGVDIPERSSKTELYELVKQNKIKVPYACNQIAVKYGHNLYYTPPYHYELQPIEEIWAVVKGEVARTSPHPNLLAIRNKLLYAFKENINSKFIVGNHLPKQKNIET